MSGPWIAALDPFSRFICVLVTESSLPVRLSALCADKHNKFRCKFTTMEGSYQA
jgi:hypothetical protein